MVLRAVSEDTESNKYVGLKIPITPYIFCKTEIGPYIVLHIQLLINQFFFNNRTSIFI